VRADDEHAVLDGDRRVRRVDAVLERLAHEREVLGEDPRDRHRRLDLLAVLGRLGLDDHRGDLRSEHIMRASVVLAIAALNTAMRRPPARAEVKAALGLAV
jgi:hypothetical protein